MPRKQSPDKTESKQMHVPLSIVSPRTKTILSWNESLISFSSRRKIPDLLSTASTTVYSVKKVDVHPLY